METKISIIVPVYNVERYLRKCLDSLVNQSYKNIEIILIDDESPDNCGNICDAYASKDNRIKVIHQKNKGLSGARNSGLKIATGEFIGFVDSDDWVDTTMFQKLLKIALDNDLDIVECNTIQTSDEELKVKNESLDNVLIENPKQAYLRILKSGIFSVWRRLYKAHIVKDYKFLLNKTSEDIYFVADNLIKASRLGHTNEILYYYRINPTSITKSGYSLKRFNDTMEGGLYLQKVLNNTYDENFNFALKKNLLLKCLQHYKKLNYHSSLDTNYVNRKRLKSLIVKNYFPSRDHEFYLKLARYLSVRWFEILIKVNNLRRKI